MNTKDIAQNIIKAVGSKHGKGAIIDMTAIPEKHPAISTGSASLDHCLGIGGFPQGRIVEIYGPEGAGKTTLALSALAQAQKMGKVGVFIDAEHALDIHNAVTLGVDTDPLLFSQPDSGEEALQIASTVIERGAGIVIIDSVAALTPKAEIEGQIGDHHMALQARMMGQAMRKIAPLAASKNCTVILINQLRMKVGVIFGNPETTPGGNAIKF